VHTTLFFSILELKPEVVFGAVQNGKTKTLIPKKEEDRILRGSERYKRIMAEFNQKAQRFTDEIRSGDFSVFETDFAECNKCDYHRICRTVYKIDRNKNQTSWRSINGF
jgi:hypothetical protein